MLSATQATTNKRILLLTTPQTYRSEAFMVAAERLNVEVVTATDMPLELTRLWDAELGIDFDDIEHATQLVVDYVKQHRVDAIIAVDDSGSLLAAKASQALGLPHNSYDAAVAARDKHRMRELLKAGGVRVPAFRLYSTGDDLMALANQVDYPCVIKPLNLNGSRGVIRANSPAEFVVASQRLAKLLNAIEPGQVAHSFLVEAFIPGFEVALEGLLDHGTLHVLALFDKPDPLDGPFFEETIYVTPSRLAPDIQAAIKRCAADAAAALGLRTGPMHAELRINDEGAWLVEVAGRSIGGLCSRTLRFGTNASLEELIIRQACGLERASLQREGQAGGVMMIPIPGEGILRTVRGVEEAEAVPGIEEVVITAQLHYPITPLPEGESYLGFIFAQGATPAEVEAALRSAHDKLHFDILPNIVLSL
jgi:biotin carboxylase